MASKLVLVTGASSGIGAATAARFFAEGWKVIATARKVPTDDLGYHWLALDLNDASSIRDFADRVLDQFGAPDAVINNAGYGLISPIESVIPEAAQRQFQANYFGTLALTQAFLPAFRERNSGTLVAVSSIGGRMAFPFFGHYNASKHALEAAFEALHHELRHTSIQIKIIEPGFTQTNFATHNMQKDYVDEAFYADGLATLAGRLESGTTGTDPKVLGDLIFDACNGRSGLRHVAGSLGKPILWARRFLPERLFLHLIGKATNP